jgi:hypothetical protein
MDGDVGEDPVHAAPRPTAVEMTAARMANAISEARNKLDGPGKDQGIRVNGHANFVPKTSEGMVFTRTPQDVLHIVYLTKESGASSGGFYPNGMNGTLKST